MTAMDVNATPIVQVPPTVAAPPPPPEATPAAPAAPIEAAPAVAWAADAATFQTPTEGLAPGTVDFEGIDLGHGPADSGHEPPIGESPEGINPPHHPTDCPPPPAPPSDSPAPPAPPSDGPSAPPPSDPPAGSPPPEASPPSVSPGSVPKDAIIIGNKKRPRTVRSFLQHMQKRGIKLPFDPATLPKELLDTKLKAGQSLAIGTDGKPIGFLDTVKDVMGNQSLGVSDHLQRKVDVKGGLPRFETLGEGGSISIDGQSINVVKTYLKSPIMLDLTGDGQLGTTGASTAKNRIDNQVGKTVKFDVDGDGKLDNTEWMSGNGDGMLVDDRDGGATRAAQGDGRIDGTRLFGDQGGKFAHGYEKLAQHDADGDGKLTGRELEGLKTWIDDGDAKVEAGELKSLAELGVTELSTGMTLEKNARGEDLMRATFVQNGQTKVTEDVWFNTKQ
ncbi:MAG: hypothetical protein VKS61_15345 [Candidatus Sericytochromatia bacterium]|nr:hypothetical protein [Candidatus Sericytochromatia bacterium]